MSKNVSKCIQKGKSIHFCCLMDQLRVMLPTPTEDTFLFNSGPTTKKPFKPWRVQN